MPNDDDLMEWLRRADPAASLAPMSSSAVDALLEEVTGAETLASIRPITSARRIRYRIASLGAASAVLLAGGGVAFAMAGTELATSGSVAMVASDHVLVGTHHATDLTAPTPLALTTKVPALATTGHGEPSSIAGSPFVLQLGGSHPGIRLSAASTSTAASFTVLVQPDVACVGAHPGPHVLCSTYPSATAALEAVVRVALPGFSIQAVHQRTSSARSVATAALTQGTTGSTAAISVTTTSGSITALTGRSTN